MASERRTHLGIDTGGTFTDVVRADAQGVRIAKVASTPADPSRAVLAGLETSGGVEPGMRIRHGTTVGTNAVLTRSGARVVFVTTAGFEDLLWIDRGHRDELHALAPWRRPPLVDRERCVGVRERMDAGGHALRVPSAASLRRLRTTVRALRPEAIAVCLLHAPRNGAHERLVREALAGLGASVHGSAALSADPREVERATTTVLDAYVAPRVATYVQSLVAALPPGALTIMRSDGGRMAAAEVGAAPVRTLLSGPAAGVAAARELAQAHGIARALSFDVGGTSTDVAWIEGDDVPLRPHLEVGPFTAGVPSVGLETVGAGGGSVIWLDPGGALRVGPDSAGADPGPACYGRGGPFTLTDAWLLLGRVPPALLGGAFPLDERASRARAAPLARRAGLSVAKLVEGAVRVAATTTARALRLASAARGNDPRDATLVAFGGAGPVLACETADRLGVSTVLVPVDPGTFAAYGALRSPLRADAARVPTSQAASGLERLRSGLERRVRTTLEREGARRIRVRGEVDARYVGQSFEVTVPWTVWPEGFHDVYAARYGFATRARPVECVRVRVRGEGWDAGDVPRHVRRRGPKRWRTRPLRRAGRLRVGSVERARLRGGDRLVGPARIGETTGTTFVPDGWLAECLADGVLRLRRRS